MGAAVVVLSCQHALGQSATHRLCDRLHSGASRRLGSCPLAVVSINSSNLPPVSGLNGRPERP